MVEFPLLYVGLIVALFCFRYYVQSSQTRKLMREIPTPPTSFLFGHTPQIFGPLEDMLDKVKNIYKDYYDGGVSMLHVWPKLFVVPLNPEAVKDVLSSTSELDKSDLYDFVSPIVKDSLLTIKTDQWRIKRKMLDSAYSLRLVKEFVPTFNEKCAKLAKLFEAYPGQGPVRIHRDIRQATLDMVCATSMGCDLDENTMASMASLRRGSHAIFQRVFQPWFYPDWIFYRCPPGIAFLNDVERTRNFTKKIIEKRQEEYTRVREDIAQDGKRRLIFLDLLLEMAEQDKTITLEEIQNEVNLFVIAGFDTNTSGIFWALYHLGLHHDIQDKVYEELERVLGDSDADVTMETINELTYLDMVCKESMRLCPSIPMIGRKFKNDMKVGKYIVPAGVECAILIYLLHRNPTYFPDPEKFDPDRFLPEKYKNLPPYTYIPFAAGPRNCIGRKIGMLEVKLVLIYLLRKFKFTNTYKGILKSVPKVVLHPIPGIKFIIEHRK